MSSHALFACLLLIALAATSYAQVGEVQLPPIREPVEENCMSYDERWSVINTTWTTVEYQLVEPILGCESEFNYNITNPDQLAGKVAVFMRGNCTFSRKVLQAHAAGAVGVIIVNTANTSLSTPIAANESNYAAAPIPVMMVSFELGLLIQENSSGIVAFKQVAISRLNVNAIFFFIAAFVCLGVGGYWATDLERSTLYPTSLPQKNINRKIADHPPEENQSMSAKHIIYLVIFASILLVLLYFLYKYLVYVIIALFYIGSVFNTHHIITRVFKRTACAKPCLTRRKMGCANPNTLDIIGFSLGLTLATVWVVYRKENWAWVLQDLLGMGLLTVALQQLRLASFRVGVLLLSVFVLYDVFFVFISPLFTKNSDSIMVVAATGGGTSSESIPMVLSIPRINVPLCQMGNSLLGFGDILVPGLVVVYSLAFDYRRMLAGTVGKTDVFLSRFSFFITAIFAYTLGLGATDIALAYMETAQPALLYLGPCLIFIPLLRCLCVDRQTFIAFWNGQPFASAHHELLDPHSDDEDIDEEVPHDVQHRGTGDVQRGALCDHIGGEQSVSVSVDLVDDQHNISDGSSEQREAMDV
eukprot:m.358915 g.358915  ORF g.358915 m.358915 type:complete len:586 (-) comp18341_c0_seq1:327-2084(-)